MDYQGNYFPEEHDENESKTYRRVKGFFKWTMYGISFLVYAIIIVTLIANRNSSILETNYWASFTEEPNLNTKTVEMYRINTKDFMEEYGTLQLYNVDYSDEYNLLEIGVKFNAKKLTDGIYSGQTEYVLTDSNGNEYKLINTVTDGRGRYGFARLCFENVDIDLESNDLRYNKALSGSLRPALSEGNTFSERTNVEYTLSVYRISDGELLYDFDIYDNTVTFNRADYEN